MRSHDWKPRSTSFKGGTGGSGAEYRKRLGERSEFLRMRNLSRRDCKAQLQKMESGRITTQLQRGVEGPQNWSPVPAVEGRQLVVSFGAEDRRSVGRR